MMPAKISAVLSLLLKKRLIREVNECRRFAISYSVVSLVLPVKTLKT